MVVRNADLLHLWVFWPGTNRSLVPSLVHVFESGLAQPLCRTVSNFERLACHLATIDECLGPLCHYMVIVYSSVIACEVDIHVQVLDPPSRSEMTIRLLVKLRPVRDAAHKTANVDKVEVVGLEGPFFFDIVDSKVAVWWDPRGLDWR